MKTLQIRKIYEIDKPLQMVEMANILKNHIVQNKLYVDIMGKNYVMVEGWQFAGGMMGLFPRVVKVEEIAKGKWMAQVEIINKKDDKIMSSGYAICSKEENKKRSFDEYAILSMAQTRAIGKAYRNLIGWVMKLAGYESTPAEEMKVKKENVIIEKKDTKQIDYVDKLKNQIIKMNSNKEMSNEQIINFINKKLDSNIVRMPTQEVAQRLSARLLQ